MSTHDEFWNNVNWIDSRIRDQNNYLWEVMDSDRSHRRKVELFVSILRVRDNFYKRRNELTNNEST